MKGGIAPLLCLLCFVSALKAQSVPLPRTKTADPKATAPGLGDPSSAARLGQPTLIVTQEAADSDGPGFQLNLTPPEPRELFRFETEEKVRQRFRGYLKNFPYVEFPPAPEAAPSNQLAPRPGPEMLATVEPTYVCYKRLWFEQTNSERYGWSFGVLQPFISTGVFYTDLALFPLHWLSEPCRWLDCSAGRCLPGDSVPLLWNPVFSR
jgi:hypothetical protein